MRAYGPGALLSAHPTFLICAVLFTTSTNRQPAIVKFHFAPFAHAITISHRPSLPSSMDQAVTIFKWIGGSLPQPWGKLARVSLRLCICQSVTAAALSDPSAGP